MSPVLAVRFCTTSDTWEAKRRRPIWQFVEFSLLWHFLTVCGFVQVSCQGFLVREACVDVLVDGAVFLLSGV